MYLKQLDIHGFKTFAERTTVVFTPGITCVIGPNGSGKSNIADAILWVLGENNVRSLRGSAALDVVFAGNDRRRPLGMAEVSLTIDNSARILPLDFSEITVTRRIFRSGESEFSINKVNCRLKDIYELFLDTGVGRDAYSMVNQGQIDQILSVRAEDRRAIFEEAAGIKKYRVRKKEAERKLEHTQQNLLRVTDIISEIETRLGPLQRQAAAAKRYRELGSKLSQLENAWYGAKLRRLDGERAGLKQLVAELQEERKRLDGDLNAAQEAEKAAREQLKQLEQEADSTRKGETDALQRKAAAEAERARAEERAGEVQRRLRALAKELEELAVRIEDQVRRQESTAVEEAGLKREVDGLRVEIGKAQTAAQEKAKGHEKAAGDLERMRQAWLARARRQAELEARVQSLRTRHASLLQEQKRAAEGLEDGTAEFERLQIEKESFASAAAEQKERAAALGQEVDKLKEAARVTEQALSALRAKADAASRAHNAAAARLQALAELGERGEGAAAGARTLLAGVRKGQVRGKWSLLVEGLRVPEGLEKAVETALGIYGDALLCESEEQALAALRWLRAQKATALILPGEPPRPEPPLPGSLAALMNGDGGPADAPHAWAHHLLSQTLVADSLEAALSQRPHSSTPRLWVTRDGAWVAHHGGMSSGAAGGEGAAAAALTRRRELDRLGAEVPVLEQAANEAREAIRGNEGEVRKAQNVLREKQSLHEKTRLEHQAQLREADRRNGDVERARHRVERLRGEVARVERELKAATESLRNAEAEIDNFSKDAPPPPPQHPNAPTPQRPPEELALNEAQVHVGKLELERREADRAVTELRVRLAQQEQRLQGAAAAARRAIEGGAFMDRQRADRLNEQRTLIAEREQRELTFGTLAEQVAEADQAIQSARETLAALAEQRAAREADLNAARNQTVDLGKRLRELMERTHRAEVELNAVETQRKHLGQQWLDAAASGHSLETLQLEETEEPLALTVDALLQSWDPGAAELTLSSYSDPEAEIGRLRRQIRALGAVNPDAVEQYAEAKERFDFLSTQRADLESAREQLEGAIREIDAASKETFLKAFREIAAAFDEMFKKLFNGGTTELRLTDPDDVLETGIDIMVQPPGKKQQNLLLLSGGERALTASAMLFALLKVRPSPFCVLDEVDAPLDEGNVGRFSSMLLEFAERTQFIVVTHNRGTMERANTLYGVTMQERGVSKVFSCSLDDPMVAQVESEQKVAVG